MTCPLFMTAVTRYDWLLFAHIVAAMVWVGGAVLLSVLALQALRSTDPSVLDRFVGNLRVIGPRVFAPSVVALVGFGVWLVIDSAAWNFDQTWIQIALGLFAGAFLVGAVFLSRAAVLAERAVARGDHADAVRQVQRWSWGYGLVVLLLVVATWDMVVKPGL